MMAFTSAKSRLMMPGTVMMSEMPCTAWRRMSSAMRNASKKLVPPLDGFHQPLVGNHDDGIHHADQVLQRPAPPAASGACHSNANGFV